MRNEPRVICMKTGKDDQAFETNFHMIMVSLDIFMWFLARRGKRPLANVGKYPIPFLKVQLQFSSVQKRERNKIERDV